MEGRAWLRTDIGHGRIGKREIVREVECDEARLDRNWFDIPMVRKGVDRFEITVPLLEPGHFEAKCFFEKSGTPAPLWPSGPNVAINVEPAFTCCANIVYNAFVRQFGQAEDGAEQVDPDREASIRVLDSAGFAVIPPSGTFRNLIRELDFIVGHLGCRLLQLLPINPTPTTYGRMGRFGSPYAALSFTAIDPALAEFDPRATPLEQFVELVDEIHKRGARILLDIAINHTGWAAALHETHPEWLVRDRDGKIENPGAWGVRWEDLTKLDFRHRDLWKFVAEVFLTWCRRGVDGFRCDAGYMIPASAWQYIIAKVRDEYPDTIFFLEGLGGKISVTRELLNLANFNWAYSELFQNYDRRQIESYLPGALQMSKEDGLAIHFAETHDNNRLAATSREFARMRTALCALASDCGGFGFANGVEWFAEEKINVHNRPSLNWGARPNQVEEIRRLGALLKVHPGFHPRSTIEMIEEDGNNGIVLLRRHEPSGRSLLILINLDTTAPETVSWLAARAGLKSKVLVDLLSGEEVRIAAAGKIETLSLSPGQVRCLSPARADLALVDAAVESERRTPVRVEAQGLRAKALDVFCEFHGLGSLEGFDPDAAGQELAADPVEFCRRLDSRGEAPRVIRWEWPRDLRREVMVPPGYFLLIRCGAPFRVRITDGNRCVAAEDSLAQKDGTAFALICPRPVPDDFCELTLKLSVLSPERCEHAEGRLLYLPRPEEIRIQKVFSRPDLLREPRIMLDTNGLGGMLRTPVSWGTLKSRYDALLAANLNREFPEDRRVLLTRCRAWIVYQGYSREINDDCLDAFSHLCGRPGLWRYRVPTGQGESTVISISARLVSGHNTLEMVFHRGSSAVAGEGLADDQPITLILRPDIEDRSFHDVTKAYAGPEKAWPPAVESRPEGFVFRPGPGRALTVGLSRGRFVPEPEWSYMVHRPLEAERGLDPDSDLFSPGFFTVDLAGDDRVALTASAEEGTDGRATEPPSLTEAVCGGLDASTPLDPESAVAAAMDAFVVRRSRLKTVIAGYPWFLDWGRDTLIFVRGLIAAGRHEIARDILLQFAGLEERGTIPNMIRGADASNRDTSDAPLWLCVACADLTETGFDPQLLERSCGERSLVKTLVDMVGAMVQGTPNGIRLDADSGLLFSPSHFTWMDTNHPAGTPRQGYPIEIQALWHAALSFLGRSGPEESGGRFREMADRVRAAIEALFPLPGEGYLSDCLHAPPGESARSATADDALRPNQLLAITLGAVTDPQLCRGILSACEELLVPGAIRSLADRPVEHPLHIVLDSRRLTDPHHPYQGRYVGDEDSKRKPAYHNGTAWTWVFPSYCEALAMVYGPDGRNASRAYLGSILRLLNHGCVGHVPEILDGDRPHAQRGCDAQAWGASELLRVWKKLASA